MVVAMLGRYWDVTLVAPRWACVGIAGRADTVGFHRTFCGKMGEAAWDNTEVFETCRFWLRSPGFSSLRERERYIYLVQHGGIASVAELVPTTLDVVIQLIRLVSIQPVLAEMGEDDTEQRY